jgi:IS5 family transposase
MLRLTSPQPDFFDLLLPAQARVLGPQLQAVDTILDDERFLAPFRARFRATCGRYTIPMETYLRLLYLKKKYELGYESLVREVADSVSWRRFCRISLGAPVPDASTLIKLTNGPCQGIAQEIHDALVAELARRKILRGRRLRVDTTVIEAEMRYPTDAGLLADGVRVITRTIRQLAEAGAEGAARFRDVRRSVQRRLGAIGRGLKQDEEKKRATRAEMTQEIVDIVRPMVNRAKRVAERIAREVEEQGEVAAPTVRRRLRQLTTWIERTTRVIDQTRQVLGGNVHIKNRLVSLFDPDARPIKKGKLNVPRGTEFGYKVLVADEERGFVTDYQVAEGNPSDHGLLVPSVKRHIDRVGRAPHGIAVDRGMVAPTADRSLEELGIKRRCLPKTGKKSDAERTKERCWWFRRLRAFRAGGEGRISLLKRKYGWRRSRVRGTERTTEWVGWGVVAHNLNKYAEMQTAKAA